MYAFVPKSLFGGASAEDFVYLYSAFGATANALSEGGFEEWAFVVNEGGGTTGGTSGGSTGSPGGGGTTGEGPSPVPEPSTYALLGSLLALAGWFKFRNSAATAA
jgi:hypothetical protein